MTNGTCDANTWTSHETANLNEGAWLMKMKSRRFLSGSVLVGLVFGLSGLGYADGYRNPPPTAEGIGKSGINSVFVDDASAISYNPANLARQTNASLVVAMTMARTENHYSPAPGIGFESDGDWVALPNIYFSKPIGDSGITWGVGIETPHGQGISWNRSDFIPAATPANTVPYEAQLALIDLNPTVAFQVSDAVSLGFGLDLYLSQLNLKALNGLVVPPPLGPGQIYFDTEAEGYGAGLGGNMAITWDINEMHRVAATYRSAFEIDYSGDFKADGVPDSDFDTSMKFPNIFTLGYGVQLTEDIRVETMVEWLQWSNNEKQTLEIEGQPPSTFVNNWDDAFTVGVGGDWQLDENWIIRAGYAFIETPIPDSTITPLLPDADRHAISLGAGYSTGGHGIDVAYTFSIYDDRGSTASGSYEIDSDLVGVTYSYSF